ncbi:MAG: FeS assembly SUF system protein [Flavobacteriales bacterium]|jgi:FeS assembly SUF system protein
MSGMSKLFGTKKSKRQLEDQIIEVIKTIYDPEIPVDIFELGLIYDVSVDADMHATIAMTLTSPSCPVAETLPVEVEEKVASLKEIKSAKVEITFEPPWDKSMMSEEAMLELGFM